MRQAINLDLTTEIDVQAAKVWRLAKQSASLELDRLRDETASLQVLIAEARRIDRVGCR